MSEIFFHLVNMYLWGWVGFALGGFFGLWTHKHSTPREELSNLILDTIFWPVVTWRWFNQTFEKRVNNMVNQIHTELVNSLGSLMQEKMAKDQMIHNLRQSRDHWQNEYRKLVDENEDLKRTLMGKNSIGVVEPPQIMNGISDTEKPSPKS